MPAGYGAITKFVTLEFTRLLVAAATMLTSPVVSTPAGRGPEKLNVAPTCAPTALSGFPGVTCWVDP